jgi:hypothetical protein
VAIAERVLMDSITLEVCAVSQVALFPGTG